MMGKKKIILFLMVVILFVNCILGWTIQSSEIKKSYTPEQIQSAFEQNRRFEWVEEYQEKDSAIFILTNRFLYKVRLLDDRSLVFDQVQSRYDYDMKFPFWTIITLFIVSGIVLIFVFILPNDFAFLKKKKSEEKS